MNNIQPQLDQLREIDQIIKDDSDAGLSDTQRFMSLVHQKDGLIDFIKKETGSTPRWTPEGYKIEGEK